MTAALRRRAVALGGYGPRRIHYIAFSGLPDFAAAAAPLGDSHASTPDWAGADYPTALARAAHGDMARVAPSDRMLGQIERLLDLSTLKAQIVPAVAGGVPCVPAYLAGHPMAMRTRRKMHHDRGEMVLAVNGWTPEGVGLDVIARRGAAVLALARAASMVRPVRIVSFAVSGDRDDAFAYTLPLDSAPIDLARAAWVLGAPEFTRQLRLAVQAATIPHGTTGRPDTQTRRFLCDMLGIDDAALVIAPGVIGDDSLADDDAAVTWINANLDTHAANP